MQTLLLYLLIMAVVVAVIFAVVWFVFGRGEDLPPIDDSSTLTRLPRNGIHGYDVRALTFALTVRGYKQSEVDWALARLADEIDDLRALIQQLQDARDTVSVGYPSAGMLGRHEADDATPAATDSVPAERLTDPAAAPTDADTITPDAEDVPEP
ncbi:DivIVA domain-containing protein [Gordonia sp. VNK1]|uniref:DivIVA domain-containing protein n=1 Tax=Gordonia oleivorans TaxID=3156618 RepID=UPI0032B33211